MNKEFQIQLVPTKELLDEVFNRFDCCAFIGSQIHTKNAGGLGWNVKGDYFNLVGLVQWLTRRIDEMEPNDPQILRDEDDK